MSVSDYLKEELEPRDIYYFKKFQKQGMTLICVHETPDKLYDLLVKRAPAAWLATCSFHAVPKDKAREVIKLLDLHKVEWENVVL